jgi:hypothetical protein
LRRRKTGSRDTKRNRMIIELHDKGMSYDNISVEMHNRGFTVTPQRCYAIVKNPPGRKIGSQDTKRNRMIIELHNKGMSYNNISVEMHNRGFTVTPQRCYAIVKNPPGKKKVAPFLAPVNLTGKTPKNRQGSISVADELTKFWELKQSGAISAEEYAMQKNKLLSQ